MTYRVVLLVNGLYKKTLHRCKTRETAFLNFYKIKEVNKVTYPKKWLNSGAIKPVNYEICVVKPTEEADAFRTLRNALGQLYTEKPLGDWTILHSLPYEVEETFTIYGYDGNDRPDIGVIVKKLVVGAHAKKMVKQVIVVHNKLIIYNENQFDMVICKCMEDAQRLHHTLAKVATKQKIKSIMFMGTATKATIGRMYDLIHEKTGWPYTKIRRTSTRP